MASQAGRLGLLALIVIGAMLLAMSIVGLVVIAKSKEYYCSIMGYGVVFDAGSSHTSMAVYQWLDETTNGTGVVSQLAYVGDCTAEGIASYGDEPDELVPGLTKCLDVAELVLPEFSHGDTPVYLGATAGMRLLTQTDAEKAGDVMESVRGTLAATPFAFQDPSRQAAVLTGQIEGTSSWITANYLAGKLGVEPATGDVVDALRAHRAIPSRPTFGALDLGGASTQVTFVPEHPERIPEESRARLRLYGTDYVVYTHSFTCYGLGEARRRLDATLVEESGFAGIVDDPCSPIGYNYTLTGAYLWKAPCSPKPQAPAAALVADTAEYALRGTSDPQACRRVSRGLFDLGAECALPPCSIGGVHTPAPHGAFKAFSGYAYTWNGIGAESTPTIQEYTERAEAFCSKTYDELQLSPKKTKYDVRYCFQSMYIRVLLIDAFKFTEENWNVEFTLKIQEASLGWALGYMVDATNRIPDEEACVGPAPAAFAGLVLIFIAVSLCGVLLAVYGLLRQARKSTQTPADRSYEPAPQNVDV